MQKARSSIRGRMTGYPDITGLRKSARSNHMGVASRAVNSPSWRHG